LSVAPLAFQRRSVERATGRLPCPHPIAVAGVDLLWRSSRLTANRRIASRTISLVVAYSPAATAL